MTYTIKVPNLEGPMTQLAWSNLRLVLGLKSSRPLNLLWSSTPVDSQLTMFRDDGFAPTRDALLRDLARCEWWRQAPGAPVANHFDVDVLSWARFFYERADETAGPFDAHGRFVRAASITDTSDLRHVAPLDRMALALRRFLASHAHAQGGSAWVVSPWPEERDFAVALSHDIDHAMIRSGREASRKVGGSVIAAAHGRGTTARRRLKDAAGLVWPSAPNPYWLMPAIAQMENLRNLSATYYVLPHTSDMVTEAGRRVRRYDVRTAPLRNLLTDLSSSGAEIALHTTYGAHESPDGLARDLQTLRSVLSDVRVSGVRSHYLRLAPETLERTRLAGLQWDSTIGWPTGWGFRSGTAFPYRAPTNSRNGTHVWELGLHLMDVAVDRPDLLAAVGNLLKQIAETGGVASILIHPNPYGDSTAREHLELYEAILDTVTSYRTAWVTTSSAIMQAWQAHTEAVGGPADA